MLHENGMSAGNVTHTYNDNQFLQREMIKKKETPTFLGVRQNWSTQIYSNLYWACDMTEDCWPHPPYCAAVCC